MITIPLYPRNVVTYVGIGGWNTYPTFHIISPYRAIEKRHTTISGKFPSKKVGTSIYGPWQFFLCYLWLNHRGRWKHGWNCLTRCVVARDNGSSIGVGECGEKEGSWLEAGVRDFARIDSDQSISDFFDIWNWGLKYIMLYIFVIYF